MKINFSKRFFKQLRKLNWAKQDLFWQRLELWRDNPDHPMLNDHALKGRFAKARSINIGGDLRAVYRLFHSGKLALFDLIGTHHQLYGK
jgi:mRNA-degrading endonuclease YafQ of YafQ-DinJ toxin-antitoxin module